MPLTNVTHAVAIMILSFFIAQRKGRARAHERAPLMYVVLEIKRFYGSALNTRAFVSVIKILIRTARVRI